jgi:hypothetical protein
MEKRAKIWKKTKEKRLDKKEGQKLVKLLL